MFGTQRSANIAARGTKLKVETLEYYEDRQLLRGVLAWDDSRPGRRPGILVFHENTGLTDHEKGRAQRLAELGYVALACDMFGERAIPASDAERRAAFEQFREKKLLPRANAGLQALAAQPQVNPLQIAAIGFCLGGMAALELARSGADLCGVVSFHGGLTTQKPAVADRMKAQVLVCHGAADPFITLEQVVLFTKEMEAAAVDFRVVLYGSAVHGFTNPAADHFRRPGIAYDRASDRRSWNDMRQFLEELFVPTEESTR